MLHDLWILFSLLFCYVKEKYRGMFEIQVQERLVSTLEHMQVRKWDRTWCPELVSVPCQLNPKEFLDLHGVNLHCLQVNYPSLPLLWTPSPSHLGLAYVLLAETNPFPHLDLYTEFDLHWIMSGFHGAFATGVACQQGMLTLLDTRFRPPFWDLLVLQLLRPDSSNLPCLYSTFHLEYPLVLRFCFSGLCNSNISRYFLDFTLLEWSIQYLNWLPITDDDSIRETCVLPQ